MMDSKEEKEKLVLEHKKKNNTKKTIIWILSMVFFVMAFMFTIIGYTCFNLEMFTIVEISIVLFTVLIIIIIFISYFMIEYGTKKFLKKNGIKKEEYDSIISKNYYKNKKNSSNYIINKKKVNSGKNKFSSKNSIAGFTPRYKIGTYFGFDDKSRKFAIYTGGMFSYIKRIVNYDNLLDVDIIQDNESLIKGGLASSLVGGMLFGGAGLIAGAVVGKKNKMYCEKLSIKITINSSTSPCEIIDLISVKVKMDSSIYNTMSQIAEEAISKFKVILINNDQAKANNQIEKKYDEKEIPGLIKQYKDLLDQGLITDEEYYRKKEQLLDL